jgi:sugar O-acyltransferase (sialic acid O-acetyltransferase NeuD family)
MKKLAIYGAGGHGRVVADTASVLGWQEIVFYDESWPEQQKNSIWPVVGNFKKLIIDLLQLNGVIVAFGDCPARLKKTRELRQVNAPMISLVHPMAYVSKNAILGLGSVVFAGAVINIEANIGEACIINTGSSVDHDCILGAGVHICPGAHLSGGVEVGEASWIGVGSCVRQGVNIGANTMIGAGAVIVKDVPSGVTMVGIAASPANL